MAQGRIPPEDIALRIEVAKQYARAEHRPITLPVSALRAIVRATAASDASALAAAVATLEALARDQGVNLR